MRPSGWNAEVKKGGRKGQVGAWEMPSNLSEKRREGRDKPRRKGRVAKFGTAGQGVGGKKILFGRKKNV